MTDDTKQTPTDALAAIFPDSAEAVQLVLRALSIGATPVAEGDEDGRPDAMRELFDATTSDVRTRVAVIAEVVRELAGTARSLVLEAKNNAGDPDILAGDAEVTEDGWLVVRMDDKEIARMPFNPRRPADGTAEKLAQDVLTEYTRLHVLGGLEVPNTVKLPAPGRKSMVAFVPDDAPKATPRAVQ